MGVALLGGDKPVPEPSHENLQRYVKFVGLACHETENLYLADELLVKLGHDWESAQKKIAEEAHKFGNKRGALAAIRGIDRKRADIKSVINEISKILDPKKLLWSVRLGKLIGEGKPTGVMEEFLGEGIVSSLWPTVAPRT